MEKIAIHRVRLLRARFYRDSIRFRECDHLGATGKLFAKTFLAPGRNYAQIRRKRCRGEFKANLVIPLPGRPVRDGISVFGERNLDHSFGDERTRDACPEEILALVNCAGLKHRKDEIAREFFLEIFDNAFRCAGFQRLLFQAVEFFLLADIGAKGRSEERRVGKGGIFLWSWTMYK